MSRNSSPPDLCLLPHLRSILQDYKFIHCGMSPKESSVSTIVKSYHWRVVRAPHPRDIIW